MGFDGVKHDRSTLDDVYLVLFRTVPQANRFRRAMERFVPPSLARIYPGAVCEWVRDGAGSEMSADAALPGGSSSCQGLPPPLGSTPYVTRGNCWFAQRREEHAF